LANATSHAVATLRELILAGEFSANERLNQSELADRIGVSRIPIRDALQILAGEGLVELSERAGARVADLSVDDLQEIYEIVETIEPLACSIAVAGVGRLTILKMQELHHLMEHTQDDDEWLSANHEFHALLYRSSNRDRMVTLIDNLRMQKDRYMRLYRAGVGDVEKLHEEHAQILAALKAGDSQGVAEWTRRHLETSHDVLLRHMLGMGRAATS
jgi:DNA-binding GntR family transcriptional regulator